MITAIERQTMKKVYIRLLPFCFVLYFICYLDRVNIGFAALTMNKDLGLSSYIFGLGAGAFFWGYFLLEVPSNLILDRVGARRWIARIMVTWGLVSGGFAFISGPVSFFTLRFLLGLAEAGFFPGHDFIFHILVPTFASRPHRRRLHGGDSGIDRARRPDLDIPPRARRRSRHRRVEVVVPLRGGTRGDLRDRDVLLSDRPPSAGGLARCGRAGVVGDGDG